MELMDALRTRRSVRNYSKKEVDEHTIEMLLEAAILAPSASNSQPWAFGYIRGGQKLRALSDRSKALLLERMKSDPGLERQRLRLEDPTVNLLHGAPALVAIYTKSTGGWAKTDCAMAALQLMLAAHALGLGTCWTGMMQRLFETDELKAVVAMGGIVKAEDEEEKDLAPGTEVFEAPPA